MFLSVREMEVRKVCFDLTYPPGEIDFLEERLWQAAPLRVEGSAELLDDGEQIRVRGRMTVRMEAECDRCLEVAPFPLDTGFDLFYRPAHAGGAGHERTLDDNEAQVGFYEGTGLELKEILREQVLLALPMQRICRQECKGICPVCGRSRNQAGCGCQPQVVDDRWSALRDFQEKTDE